VLRLLVPPFTHHITRHISMIAQGSCVHRADAQRGVGVAYGHPQRVVSSYASTVSLARASEYFEAAVIELSG
jgi:hypothetical protein